MKEILVSPTELNGFAWALLIGGIANKKELPALVRSLTGVDSEDVFSALEQQLEEGRKQLETDEVEILLSADDAPAAQRLESLALWCQSFLSLLGQSKAWKNEDLTSRIHPLLEDFAAFSQLDIHSRYESEEEFEQYFTEIYEYLRVGIMYLNLEFAKYKHE